MLVAGQAIANQSIGMASVDDSTIAKKGVDGVVGIGFGRAAFVKGNEGNMYPYFNVICRALLLS